jgi:hypothetical protein
VTLFGVTSVHSVLKIEIRSFALCAGFLCCLIAVLQPVRLCNTGAESAVFDSCVAALIR